MTAAQNTVFQAGSGVAPNALLIAIASIVLIIAEDLQARGVTSGMGEGVPEPAAAPPLEETAKPKKKPRGGRSNKAFLEAAAQDASAQLAEPIESPSADSIEATARALRLEHIPTELPIHPIFSTFRNH